MKTNRIISFLLVLFLCSCNASNEDIAKSNIEKYLTDSLFVNEKIVVEEYSKLYIIDPHDIDKIPKPTAIDKADERVFKKEVHSLLTLHSTPLMLVLKGCTPDVFKDMKENDEKFSIWDTGGNRYAMLCFFKAQDKYLNEENLGLCFVLDSVMTVTKKYPISNINIVHKMMTNE